MTQIVGFSISYDEDCIYYYGINKEGKEIKLACERDKNIKIFLYGCCDVYTSIEIEYFVEIFKAKLILYFLTCQAHTVNDALKLVNKYNYSVEAVINGQSL